jgi:hypothetical protein
MMAIFFAFLGISAQQLLFLVMIQWAGVYNVDGLLKVVIMFA